MAARDLTAARLREVLFYEPETGAFTWRHDRPGFHRAGEVAGRPNDGYLLVDIDGVSQKLHRLAWLYVTGEWPAGQIDHWNTNRCDNRFRNLRDASLQVNNQNLREAKSTNILGFLGVSPVGRRFQARITVDRKQRSLGVYDTPEQAHAVYLAEKRRAHVGNTL